MRRLQAGLTVMILAGMAIRLANWLVEPLLYLGGIGFVLITIWLFAAPRTPRGW